MYLEAMLEVIIIMEECLGVKVEGMEVDGKENEIMKWRYIIN